MIATIVLEDRTAGDHIARQDMDSIPLPDEVIEIKGADYVVRSRRWKLGKLGSSVTVTVRAVLETTV